MYVDPVDKFFSVSAYSSTTPPSLLYSPQETSDAARNDREETVPPEIMDQLREMGAFGLQVKPRPTDDGCH